MKWKYEKVVKDCEKMKKENEKLKMELKGLDFVSTCIIKLVIKCTLILHALYNKVTNKIVLIKCHSRCKNY